MLLSSLYSYYPFFCLLAGSGVILGAVYMFSVYQKTFLGETNTATEKFIEIDLKDKLILIPLVILIFIFGLFPDLINTYTDKPVNEIINTMQIHLNELGNK